MRHALCLASSVAITFSLGGGDANAQIATPGQRVLTGLVTDTTGELIPHAIALRGPLHPVVADDSGRLRLVAGPKDQFTLTVRRIGYQPRQIDIHAGSDTTLVIELTPIARALSPTVVTAMEGERSLQLHGFYERLADRRNGLGAGFFVTPEELDWKKPMYVTNMVEGFPGIRVLRGSMPAGDVILGANRCPLSVYLDGMRMVGEPVNALVNSRSVAGVEVYPRAMSVPSQYQQPNETCGALIVWTK